jgi:hypothetical protein
MRGVLIEVLPPSIVGLIALKIHATLRHSQLWLFKHAS